MPQKEVKFGVPSRNMGKENELGVRSVLSKSRVTRQKAETEIVDKAEALHEEDG